MSNGLLSSFIVTYSFLSSFVFKDSLLFPRQIPRILFIAYYLLFIAAKCFCHMSSCTKSSLSNYSDSVLSWALILLDDNAAAAFSGIFEFTGWKPPRSAIKLSGAT